MNPEEANKIIEAYKASIAKGTEGDTVLRRVSLLPYSKAKIKYAYFVFLENTVQKEGRLAGDLRNNLAEEYSILNNFVNDEQAKKYAKIYQDWQSKKSDLSRDKKDERLIKQYIAYIHTLGSDDLLNEINDYITELLAKK